MVTVSSTLNREPYFWFGGSAEKYFFKVLTWTDEKHLLKTVRRKKELHWDLRLIGGQALPAFKTIRYEYEVP